MISRVTDPRNLTLVGLPPRDLLDDIMAGWKASGYDAIELLRGAVSVTQDWIYVPDSSLAIVDRVQRRRKTEKDTGVHWRNLKYVLNPQKDAQEVIHKLLDWIERVDRASQTGAPRPAFETLKREPIFPEDEENKWWLTNIQNRKTPETLQPPADEDGAPSSQGEHLSDEDKNVSDEDPSSADECDHGVTGTQTQEDLERRPASFVPRAHWPKWEGCNARVS